MSEAEARSQLVSVMKPLHAVAIENSLSAGVPDVNYAHGWIELKYLPAWPKGANIRPVRPRHPLMAEQREFIRKRYKVGGVSLVCWKISREWLFFDGPVAAEIMGNATRPELYARSCFMMSSISKQKSEFLEWISSYT